MPVPSDRDVDWSDSDEEDERSDVETSVLLGIPDGAIEKQEDLSDAAVSRIGGHPAFLTKEPSLSTSQCKSCSFPMELLVQLWCPFEDSTMDRALYIFGCARGECQNKPGSVRAFRGLRFNATYAAKLEKKLARQREKDVARRKAEEEEGKRKAATKINPFSMNTAPAPSGGLFGAPPTFGSGLGSQLFGAPQSDVSEPEPTDGNDDEAPPPPESESESESESSDDESAPSSESEKSILAIPASAPSSSSPWLSSPAYLPALYLSTTSEYVPPAPKPKIPLSAGISADLEDEKEGKSRKAEARRGEKEKEDAKAWDAAMEGYEDSMEVDKVFERFARVAGYEGEQCIRYELNGTPLPFSNDALFKSLFPSPSSAGLGSSISTSSKFTPATVTSLRRMYDAQSNLISPCPRCGGPRTFECQLMPHLISVLTKQTCSSAAADKLTPAPDSDPANKEVKENARDENQDVSGSQEARKKEVDQLLRGAPGTGKRGMEWGTCLIFSCVGNCCLEDNSGNGEEKTEAKENWVEELVLVQWDE